MSINRQLHILGRLARRHIGAHYRAIGSDFTNDQYQALRARSDEWVSRIKYLICQLDNRDHAVQLARAAGMGGYINMR